MTAQIFKFPYNAQRRLHSRRPRRSKNGTPEGRAAKAAANLPPAAAVVPLPVQVVEAPHEKEGIDRRKLRGSPLRDQCAAISFGATVVGTIHTAGLKGEPLEAIPAEIRIPMMTAIPNATSNVTGRIPETSSIRCVTGVGFAAVSETIPDYSATTTDIVKMPRG